METEIIRYNLKERGRQYRGKERNFDIPRIVKAINGGVTQEKVKHRDMLGYYGHWPRIKFGMNPAEGGVVDGKAVAVEPAMITTYLRALDDGTVEHKAEFLDTNAGRLAERLYKSKAGGFSSAIDENRPEFFGFDYVLEPNFTTNRGYRVALDGVDATLDDVAIHDYNQQLVGVLRLLDSLNAEHERTLQVVSRLNEENEQYRSMLSTGRTLDSLEAISGGILPIMADVPALERLRRDIRSFHTAELARIDVPKKAESVEQKQDDHFIRRFLRF